MRRVYNFSAGPAMLPEEVLREASEEMLDYRGHGMSVMEMSHRSSMFREIIEQAERDLRELMDIPENYRVLFIQGGGHVQFAMAALNLMVHRKAEYIVSGQWAKKALSEAKRYGDARAVASSEDKCYSYIPDCSDLPIREDADYLDALTDEEAAALVGLLDKLIDALETELGVDGDDDPSDWMAEARRRMGDGPFEAMMRMREQGFGPGPFGGRGPGGRRGGGRGPRPGGFGPCFPDEGGLEDEGRRFRRRRGGPLPAWTRGFAGSRRGL